MIASDWETVPSVTGAVQTLGSLHLRGSRTFGRNRAVTAASEAGAALTWASRNL